MNSAWLLAWVSHPRAWCHSHAMLMQTKPWPLCHWVIFYDPPGSQWVPKCGCSMTGTFHFTTQPLVNSTGRSSALEHISCLLAESFSLGFAKVLWVSTCDQCVPGLESWMLLAGIRVAKNLTGLKKKTLTWIKLNKIIPCYVAEVFNTVVWMGQKILLLPRQTSKGLERDFLHGRVTLNSI